MASYLAGAGLLKKVSLRLPVTCAAFRSRFTSISAIRCNAALASARASLSQNDRVQPLPPMEDDLPGFETLRGAVDDKLLKAIVDHPMNLKTMSPVQARVLPMLSALAEPYDPSANTSQSPPRDLLVKAKTGTGKTLAFLVPAIQARLKQIQRYTESNPPLKSSSTSRGRNARSPPPHRQMPLSDKVGTLIISPTRELATQIAKEAVRLTSHMKGFGVRLIVGGESKGMQLRLWSRERCDIVVGTPGRLFDLIESEPMVEASLAQTQVLVLDEADTLLDMGFRPDIEAIKKHLPPVPERQTFLFSATVSPAIQQIAESTLAPNHEFINCVSKDTSPVHAHVPQYHTVLPTAKDQIPHLLRLVAHDQLANPQTSKVIVFLPTTKMTQLFATFLRELAKTGLPAGQRTAVYEIHSKKTMEARTRASNGFRNDTSGAAVLVTSDVSARGVDYPRVTRVVQVGVPTSTEQYIHRVGRTGRAGSRDGRGDLVLLPWEMGFLRYALGAVPLKPLRVQDLETEVRELSQKVDEGGNPNIKNNARGLFKSSLVPLLDQLPESINNLMGRLDEEAINETFMSLLGYYVGQVGNLHVRKDEVLDGLKQWSTEALGLSVPPYVGPMFLQKLGIVEGGGGGRGRGGGGGGRFGLSRDSNDGRGGGYGFSRSGQSQPIQEQDYRRRPQKHSWEERGSRRSQLNRSAESSERRASGFGYGGRGRSSSWR